MAPSANWTRRLAFQAGKSQFEFEWSHYILPSLIAGYLSFHGPVCDQAFRSMTPYVGKEVSIVVGPRRAQGHLLGLAETPTHVMRVFIGSEVVEYIAGETVVIEEKIE